LDRLPYFANRTSESNATLIGSGTGVLPFHPRYFWRADATSAFVPNTATFAASNTPPQSAALQFT
jgi:hypothetical protein